MEMTHENGYLWLLFAWYPPMWWSPSNLQERNSYVPVNCSREEIESMVEFAVPIDVFPYVADENRQDPTSSNMVSFVLIKARGGPFQ